MAPRASTLPRPTGAALARTANGNALGAAEARSRTRVHLVGFGHPCGAELLTDVGTLLTRAGLRTRRPRNDHVTGAVPVIGVVVGVGEPDRELMDDWLRQGVPFLLVRATEGRAVVGPFVEPGRTACLRCIDAHHTDLDAAWPLLVQQYSRAASQDRADGTPEPLDPTQVAAALALAVHDVAVYADGLQPNSWSATVTVGPDLVQLHTHRWHRHPECGCWWE
jgi:bacteriocin biosynthesis cyclodehydratase domain-containing protein